VYNLVLGSPSFARPRPPIPWLSRFPVGARIRFGAETIMPRVAITPSAPVAELLRDLRLRRRLTLRDVEEQSGKLGEAIPYSTLARVERGLIDPGIRRLHLLLRLYGVPLSLAGDMLDLEIFGASPRGTPAELEERGLTLWKAGKTKDALRHLFTIRRRIPDSPDHELARQRALLAFAVAAGSLGKRLLAREIVDGLLAEPPHPDLTVPVFIEAAVCWHWLGGKQTALAFLERAEKLAGKNPRHRAWIAHLKASTLVDLGDLKSAATAIRVARGAYRTTKDHWGMAKLQAAEVKLAFAQGLPARACELARAAQRHAATRGFPRLAILRQIEEGQAHFLLKRFDDALTTLTAALGGAQIQADPLAQFYAHYWRWKLFYTTAEPARAALERQSAEYFAQFVDDLTPEVLAVKAETTRRRT